MKSELGVRSQVNSNHSLTLAISLVKQSEQRVDPGAISE